MVTILGANSVSGYEISNSLRFNDDDSPLLSITFGQAPTNAQKCTFSMWYKMTAVAASTSHIYRYNDGSDTGGFNIRSDDFPHFFFTDSGGGSANLNANPTAQRDPSAWYHVVIACDTTLSTATNRARMYINGVEQTTFATDTAPGQNTTLIHNANGETYYVGGDGQSSNRYWDGCLADFYLVDGQQLEPTDFGEYNDDGVWIPINYTGSCGDNGFKLEFKETGTSQNAAGIGADTSGSGNHFAVANLAATDVITDTPTNNFATLNPLSDLNCTFSEGNTEVIRASDAATSCVSTIAPASGKWYYEFQLSASNNIAIGVVGLDDWQSGTDLNNYANRAAVMLLESSLNISVGYVASSSSTTTLQDSTQLVTAKYGMAVDLDNGNMYASANGSYYNSTSGAFDQSNFSNATAIVTDIPTGEPMAMAFRIAQSAAYVNFGNAGGDDTISSGNADADGHGNFEFAVPSGYFALCTKNLAKYG